MKINVHAGHNPDGKIACGAIGFVQESTEARKVKDEVIRQLRKMGHSAFDCTCEDGKNQPDVLHSIVQKCNKNEVDIDISIHFNSGAKDERGNGKTTGVEALIYSTSSKSKECAEKLCSAISMLGFRNRGVKVRNDLYFLRKTKAPAVLIECCFVDDKDDVNLYDYRSMANAIVFGITGKIVAESEYEDVREENKNEETETGDKNAIYRVQVGSYSVKKNAENMQKKLKEAGFDAILVKS